MILRIGQMEKDYFAAEFLFFGAEKLVGGMNVRGSLIFTETTIDMELFGNRYHLYPSTKNPIYTGFPLPDERDTAYRPYNVSKKGKGIQGMIYQVDRKTGKEDVCAFYQMEYAGKWYDLYPVSFESEGELYLLYCGSQQIAQVEKDMVIVDGQYAYNIYAVDQTAAEIAVLMCAYIYMYCDFKPVQKTNRSVVIYTKITTDKTLLEKYDPTFKNMIIKGEKKNEE